MKIVAISGSAANNSSTAAFLYTVRNHFSGQYEIEVFDRLRDFPLFRPEELEKELPELIQEFKNRLIRSDAILICTPEYTHNIPAVLKNALEWITASGELAGKKVLPVTLTPHEPRGEWAMKSLLASLITMKATIVAELPLYKDEMRNDNGEIGLNETTRLILEEAFRLF